MSQVSIDRALEVAAATALGSSFASRIATEGNPFTPPSSGAWAQFNNLRAGTDTASLGVGGMDESVGVYQIDVSVPVTSANPKSALLGYADTLKGYFVTGRRFTHSSQGVRVVRADVSAIRQVDGWQRISVSVTYSAFTIRPEV